MIANNTETEADSTRIMLTLTPRAQACRSPPQSGGWTGALNSATSQNLDTRPKQKVCKAKVRHRAWRPVTITILRQCPRWLTSTNSEQPIQRAKAWPLWWSDASRCNLCSVLVLCRSRRPSLSLFSTRSTPYYSGIHKARSRFMCPASTSPRWRRVRTRPAGATPPWKERHPQPSKLATLTWTRASVAALEL